MSRGGSGRSKSSAGTIIAMLVFLASAATLLYLPIRRGKPEAKLAGVLGIIGLLSSLIWWVMTHEQPPLELKVVAALSGALYLLALVFRVAGGKQEATPVNTASLGLGGGEVRLYEAPARFLGERRVRAFGGLGFRVARGVSAGLGLSVPVSMLSVVDEGSLVVTNRRVIFAGARGTVTVKARSILDAGSEGEYLVVRPERGHMLVAEVRDPGSAAGAVRSAMELAG